MGAVTTATPASAATPATRSLFDDAPPDEVLSIAFLGSGSSGNCAVVRCGRTTVLLDAGLSPRDTGRRLEAAGVSLDDVCAVFLTHEHSDHVRGAAGMAKRGLPVYATAGTAAGTRLPGPLFADVRPLPAGRETTVGGILVRAVATPHDGAESVCYVFTDGAGRRIGVATDLGHMSVEVARALSGCEVIGLEANHDPELLRSGPYPRFLKQRILSDVGHLSNDDAAAALLRLVGPRTRAVAALHVSQQNNTPALARLSFERALSVSAAGIPLEVAPPDRPTPWLSTAHGPSQEERP